MHRHRLRRIQRNFGIWQWSYESKIGRADGQGSVPVAPRATAWMVSVPGTVAVTFTVAWPVESVVTVVAPRVFPSIELKVTYFILDTLLT